MPNRTFLVDEIPKTTTGKFDKKVLLDEFEDGYGSLQLEGDG